ncbi:uncharacterized protein LOC134331441 [Trichomycterus rosablanca]|uniref:uncharacterized protein LOC134331441 n=1 Tax=Trichomycterus rosablanca TaxID=2290929 RepID=UPI002F35BDAC
MYYIVEFLQTNEVAVVPSIWVKNGMCQWPLTYKMSDIMRATRNQEQPGDHWESYSIKILYTTDNYNSARLKLPEAEAMTDIHTAEEDQDDTMAKKSKRKKIPNKRLLDSESDDELPIKKSKKLPPPPVIKYPNPGLASSKIQPRPVSPETGGGSASPETGGGSASPETRRGTSQSRRWPSQTHDFASVLHHLLIKQEMVIDQLKIILRTVQAIQGSTGGPSEQDFDEGALPLTDLESLLDLENVLKNEQELKNKMITALGLNGGVDLKDTVWRIMKRTVTNSLAKKLNWRGINGKTAFNSLLLKDVIAGAVRRNRLTRLATNQEIEFYIRRWLHLAIDREGGRRLRQERRSVL